MECAGLDHLPSHLSRDEVASFLRSVLPSEHVPASEGVMRCLFERLDVDHAPSIRKDELAKAVVESLQQLSEDSRTRLVTTMQSALGLAGPPTHGVVQRESTPMRTAFLRRMLVGVA